MSAKGQRDLIKGGPRPPAKQSKGEHGKSSNAGIPTQGTDERDAIIERLKQRKDS